MTTNLKQRSAGIKDWTLIDFVLLAQLMYAWQSHCNGLSELPIAA